LVLVAGGAMGSKNILKEAKKKKGLGMQKLLSIAGGEGDEVREKKEKRRGSARACLLPKQFWIL